MCILDSSCVTKLRTYQLDIKTAFLNADLKVTVYVKPPSDMVTILKHKISDRKYTCTNYSIIKLTMNVKKLREYGNASVLKLRKALYGLKEAPRAWYEAFDRFLKSIGFRSNSHDACFCVNHVRYNAFIMIIIYVDDISLSATDNDILDQNVRQIVAKFTISSEGPVDTFLNLLFVDQ